MTSQIKFFFLSFLSFAYLNIQAQDITGIWISVDDKDGEPSAHIEITEESGKYHAYIRKNLDPAFQADAVCEMCKGDKKNKPIIGMEIMWGMEKKGDEYKNGKIMDPENGKTYKCKLKVEDNGKLAVRGFIGFSLLGRTQFWQRP